MVRMNTDFTDGAGNAAAGDAADVVPVMTDVPVSADAVPAPATAPNQPKRVLQVPVADVAWLHIALQDALKNRAVLVPLASGAVPLSDIEIAQIHPDTAVILRTSGSSGVPKAVELSAAALIANAKASHAALGGDGQWLVALPLTSMGGLGQLVRSVVSGIHPEVAVGANAAQIITLAQRLTHARRYLSLVPAQLSDLLDLADASQHAAQTLQSFDAILVGGGVTPLALRQRAWELGLNLVRTYGSTETAGGCVYDGVEIGDTQVRIRDGEVQLAGSSLALGYLGDSQLSARSFVSAESVSDPVPQSDTADVYTAAQRVHAADKKRWYRTGDAGNLLGGVLEITGRLDRVYISGGVNVSLDRVENVLQRLQAQGSLPAGMMAAVAVPHPKWGQRLVVVCSGTHPPTAQMQQEATAALEAELGKAAKPLAFAHRSKLPLLANGKVDLQTLTTEIREHYDA